MTEKHGPFLDDPDDLFHYGVPGPVKRDPFQEYLEEDAQEKADSASRAAEKAERSARAAVEAQNRAEEAKEVANEARKTLAEVQKQLGALEQQTKDDKDRFEKDLRRDKLQSIQILAIFVAFFTFVSVEFQLFSNITDPLAVLGLSSLLFGALLVFVCLVLRGLGANDTKGRNAAWWKRTISKDVLLISAALAFVMGVGVYWWLGLEFDRASSSRSTTCSQIEAQLLDNNTGTDLAVRLQELHKSMRCHGAAGEAVIR